MKSTIFHGLVLGAAMLALPGCNKAANTTQKSEASDNVAAAADSSGASSSDPVASAESAAPASIARAASIMTIGADGKATILRQGTNGWTCMPDSPATPGPDPMCADSNAMKWADAWIHHKPPPEGAVGVMYMLEGGTDASNSDPYATKPTSENDWIKTGPHVMVVGSKEVLAGYPSGAKPDTSAPYVMWSGTPYAHLMVPIDKGS
ncbi:MAG TPA: hypothetical protein VHE36_14215 [Sphingomicrobium sp.]|jgi:hypothetical protein|nr:hypothetical protein [Sphingomicrobium sp.]